MELELRFFATFRSAVGQKTIEREYEDGATVRDVLLAIEDEFPELTGELIEDGEIPGNINVLHNGRDVTHEEGLATVLGDGDTVSVFPPVAGGADAR